MHIYDLTVHLDEDGDPILEGTTPAGEEYANKLRGAIVGDLVIGCTAEEFMEMVPRELTIGLDDGAGRVNKLCPPPLH